MRNALALVDVSPIVYTGEKADRKRKVKKQFPLNGAQHFLTVFVQLLETNSDVILCFDSQSFRKKLLPQYKRHRKPDIDVHAQLEMLYQNLSKIGVCCLKQEGAEADDLIHTCVQRYKDEYRHIYIYTADKDLAHNIDDTVELVSVNSNMTDIEKDTYEALLNVPYNSITAYKLFFGDQSDNIPSIGKSASDYFSLYVDTLNQLEDASPDYLKTREFMELFLNSLNTEVFDENEIELIRKRLDILYPKCYEFDYEFTPTNKFTVHKGYLTRLLNTLDCDTALERLNMYETDIDNELEEYLRTVGDSISRGTYAIDNSIVNSCGKMDIKSCYMKEF